MRLKIYFIAMVSIFNVALFSQNTLNNPNGNHANKFEQLEGILPTPNEQRTASGAPGKGYWQQKVDYDIKCQLDENLLMLTGSEIITYHNNSPNALNYLWFQLDENQHSTVNNANYQNESSLPKQSSIEFLEAAEKKKSDNGYGFNIKKLTDGKGKALQYTINKTMMKVELPVSIPPGGKYVIKLDWNYKLIDRMNFLEFGGGRGGFEYFAKDGNHIFTMAQWYPRLCMYNDVYGWQNHQFTGRGEFTVCFGDFKVQMTVPSDHVVGGTGECKNYSAVLNPTQKARWAKAQTSTEPLQIITLDDVKAGENNKAKTTKTWIYEAKNVRDFAWTTSRRFVWDAMPQNINGQKVMCMSFYGKEAYPIYSKYSTKAVAHTIKTYSEFTFPYPYPVAISVEAANGMEYPMISFNPGRAQPDGTYTEGAKNAAILVIIHEVGHTFYPMIVNSDERQWSWMDEGLNSYLQYLTQELWDNKFPSDAGPAFTIVDYMKSPKDRLEPIMTNSENIINFGSNAYDKVATGLNILRESIVGRELFDKAFREYSRRWMFKHPTPADFFRTMEDATGEDLDWFWRGWFYSTDACDISLDTVKYAVPNLNAKPKITKDTVKMVGVPKPSVNDFEDISKIRNKEDKNIKFVVDQDTALQDFYYKYDRGIEKYDTAKYEIPVIAMQDTLDHTEKNKYANRHAYELTFSNKGGLVMPLIIEWKYKDGTSEIERIPVQIWRKNESKISKTFYKTKAVESIQLDPFKETADVDESNNVWNKAMQPNKFDVFKQKKNATMNPGAGGINPMQAAKKKNGKV